MLGEHADVHVRPSIQSLLLQFLAKNFGSVFILAMAQRARSRSPYAEDPDATEEMAADEGDSRGDYSALATSGGEKLSGNFRAAVFGANDGLVSNLALTMGITASGASSSMVLLSGIAGLLAGALSMAAGEFVSVRSQRELLDASQPTQVTLRVAHDLDLDSNELELIYRARGMGPEAAHHRAMERFGYLDFDCDPSLSHREDEDRVGECGFGHRYWCPLLSFCVLRFECVGPDSALYFRFLGCVPLWCCLCCLWVRLWALPAAWWVCVGASPPGAVSVRF